MTKLTWEDIDRMTDQLAEKIKASGFKPDYIIGITSGGLIPLYFLVKKLGDLNNILTITATSYDKNMKKDLQIVYLPDVDLKNKRVLLVDEIISTGDTLKSICEILITHYQIGEIKTAVLGIHTDKNKFHPDFHIHEEPHDWVVFPWEKGEFPEYF